MVERLRPFYQFIIDFGSSSFSVKHPSLLLSNCGSIQPLSPPPGLPSFPNHLPSVPLLTRGTVKVNVCDERIIRVFLSSKTMLHRESLQIIELYLAALTRTGFISSADSTFSTQTTHTHKK